jgi:hypothetical protein
LVNAFSLFISGIIILAYNLNNKNEKLFGDVNTAGTTSRFQGILISISFIIFGFMGIIVSLNDILY